MAETNSGDPSRSSHSVIDSAPAFACPDTGSLYRMHMHQVGRWAERLAGPNLDWEDIVHEVFVVAHQRIHGFRGEANITTWLFSITAKVVQHRRRKERWRRWLSGSADDTAGHLPGAVPDPLRMVERKQAAALVYRVLDRLSERDRQILILCELDELTADEVGELLGIKPANARLRLHRAHARFLRVYEAYERRQGRRDHDGG
jgi:RNA polymerase sigma-70 factor, ECF subfamily